MDDAARPSLEREHGSPPSAEPEADRLRSAHSAVHHSSLDWWTPLQQWTRYRIMTHHPLKKIFLSNFYSLETAHQSAYAISWFI
mmetsp:Transcript_1185/g.2773  ORF Transcript_1185/g.2773 Transcript_1185/m.2773 type:complete len:84 (-) Transcript_1185:282-533(-)